MGPRPFARDSVPVHIVIQVVDDITLLVWMIGSCNNARSLAKYIVS